MNIEKMFYAIGVIFAIFAIVFFASEFILSLSKSVKLTILIILAVALFFLARYLQESDF